MRHLIERLSESVKGSYWGRRASDSKVMKMKDGEAKAVIKRAAAKKAPSDWLLVWWVPPEYSKEAKSRVESGWIKPLWDWGKGPSGLKMSFDSVVKEEREHEFAEGCADPGKKKRSKGKGKGLGKGDGEGPMGKPVDEDELEEWGGRRRGGAYSNDPRWMKAKREGIDSDGTPYKKDAEILYFPIGRKVLSGAKADKAWREFQAQRDDERMMSQGYGEDVELEEAKMSREEKIKAKLRQSYQRGLEAQAQREKELQSQEKPSKHGTWDKEDLISVYTRAQAMKDGELVDVSDMARGYFKYPVAFTRAVWYAVERAAKGPDADLKGIMHDILFMMQMAGKRGGSSAKFKVKVGKKDYNWMMVIGPGDTPSPVITVGYPQDF